MRDVDRRLGALLLRPRVRVLDLGLAVAVGVAVRRPVRVGRFVGAEDVRLLVENDVDRANAAHVVEPDLGLDARAAPLLEGAVVVVHVFKIDRARLNQLEGIPRGAVGGGLAGELLLAVGEHEHTRDRLGRDPEAERDLELHDAADPVAVPQRIGELLARARGQAQDREDEAVTGREPDVRLRHLAQHAGLRVDLRPGAVGVGVGWHLELVASEQADAQDLAPARGQDPVLVEHDLMDMRPLRRAPALERIDGRVPWHGAVVEDALRGHGAIWKSRRSPPARSTV